jgi:purine-nucleoside phosphorylase
MKIYSLNKMKETPFTSYRKAAAVLKSILESLDFPSPKVGIICGSGLSGLSNTLSNPITIKYSSIPGFPSHTSLTRHKSEIVFGLIDDGTPIMCFRRRFNHYEGHDMNTVSLPAHIMRCLGVKLFITTNAAGGLNPSYNVGDIVNVMDYFAVPMSAGKKPKVGGLNDDEVLEPRFTPVSDPFDPSIQSVVLKSAKGLSMDSFVRQNGTHCFVSAPMHESRAKSDFLRSAGGDSVGMCTVPEIIAAHHSGMKVMCLSLITNKINIEEDEEAHHQEVVDDVSTQSEQLQTLVKEVVKELDRSGVLNQLSGLGKINFDLAKHMTTTTTATTNKRTVTIYNYYRQLQKHYGTA